MNLENLTIEEIKLLESAKRHASVFKVSLKSAINILVDKKIKNLNQKQTAALNNSAQNLINRLTDEA